MQNSTLLTVSEALERARKGESLSSCSVDFKAIKVEALDAIQLNKAGLQVPQEAIYYDDDAIAYDEDFEGDW